MTFGVGCCDPENLRSEIKLFYDKWNIEISFFSSSLKLWSTSLPSTPSRRRASRFSWRQRWCWETSASPKPWNNRSQETFQGLIPGLRIQNVTLHAPAASPGAARMGKAQLSVTSDTPPSSATPDPAGSAGGKPTPGAAWRASQGKIPEV